MKCKLLNSSIEKEEKATGGKYITAARANVYADDKSDDMVTEDDLNAVKAEFQKVVGDLLQKNQANRAKIPAVIDKYLPGKKVSDAKVGDIDAIRLIIKDLGTL